MIVHDHPRFDVEVKELGAAIVADIAGRGNRNRGILENLGLNVGCHRLTLLKIIDLNN